MIGQALVSIAVRLADTSVSGESWPILAAFLALQTTITAPILGFIIKQNSELRAEKDARLADRDKTIADKDKEIAELKAEKADLMDMAFDAVRGMNSATGAARDSVQIAREERARRGTR